MEQDQNNSPPDNQASSPSQGYFGFDVAEVTKISLGPGDVLSVVIKNDDVSHASLGYLQRQLKDLFPNNNVIVLGVGTNDEVRFTVVKQENKGYCSDCTCGKKEQAETPTHDGPCEACDCPKGDSDDVS